MADILFREIYQILFIMSATYFTCVVLLFGIRFIRNVVYNVNTTMSFSVLDKILLLLSLAISIAYLI